MNTQPEIKEYMSKLGKTSAASPLRNKEYYAERGRRSAASKKAKKLGISLDKYLTLDEAQIAELKQPKTAPAALSPFLSFFRRK